MIAFCPARRYLQPAQWLNRIQIRRLGHGQLYQELLAQKQRSHLQGLFPTKPEDEIEELRRIRNEIWPDQNGGMKDFVLIKGPSLLWTDR